MKGVVEMSGASRYDDLIAHRYHSPRIYLRAAEACPRPSTTIETPQQGFAARVRRLLPHFASARYILGFDDRDQTENG